MFFSGVRLKVAREFQFKTIEGLVQALEIQHDFKINKGMVSRWENNKAVPRVDAVATLAECLKVPTGYLLGGKDLGSIMLELRLKSGLSPEKLSEISGVAREYIVLIEGGLDVFHNEKMITNIGKALNIDNLRDHIRNEGFSGVISGEDMSKYNKKNSELENNINLYSFLDGQKSLYCGSRLLTSKEIDKIKRLIEIMLEE